MRRALVGAILASAACGPAVDPAKLAAVQVVGTEAPLRGCRLLGPLVGTDDDRWVPGGPRYEKAMLDLRKKAVLGGGTHLVTDAIEPPRESDAVPAFVVRARLFACSADGAPEIGAPAPIASTPVHRETPKPPTQPACEPDCSPGYTCLRGACVSACNPVCTGGERCGVDRICHPLAPIAPPPALPR